jgi:hypothetical protein
MKRTQGDWNANNVQLAGGGFLVVEDDLYFCVSGRTGRPGGNETGTLTRSGFQWRLPEGIGVTWRLADRVFPAIAILTGRSGTRLMGHARSHSHTDL